MTALETWRAAGGLAKFSDENTQLRKYLQGIFTGFPENSLPIYTPKRSCWLQGSSENLTWTTVRREDARLKFTLAQVYTTGQIHANETHLCLQDEQRAAFCKGEPLLHCINTFSAAASFDGFRSPV